jgi:prepilin-type N-terminal cleavage/methylation domain-containing protein
MNGFTLVELLVVIAIIAVLAGFAIPVLKSVKRTQYITHAKAEMNQIGQALENYKTAYHFYPPGNGNNYLTNQLYYELTGMTTTNANDFTTLDGVQTLSRSDLTTAFGNVNGFVNCTRPGAGEDSAVAQDFLHEKNPNQTKSFSANGVNVTLLVTTVRGPDANYQPLGVQDLNPWRYRSPGVNNPNGYDLWIQLVISGRTNLVCNWSAQAHINDLSVP